jgi:uncharacterized protein
MRRARQPDGGAAALSSAVADAFRIYANLDGTALPKPLQVRLRLPNIDDPGLLADSVAPLLSVGIDQRQQLLEIADVAMRLEKILESLKMDQRAA